MGADGREGGVEGGVRGGRTVISTGHTHSPEERWERGVLYLNPGSAGPVRGTKPVSMAILKVGEDGIFPRFLDLL